jgi:purine nucleosidase
MPIPIIIDTDPGQDDCIAILLALASPELEVLGLTAVAGNVPLALTAKNALKICELAGRAQVPVFAGCDRPLLEPPLTAETVHGRTGLDGAELPEPRARLRPAHAVDWLIETLMARGDAGTTVVAVGPLTNIAMALRRAPTIADKIDRLVIMGGSLKVGGNVTPAAEFNIAVDPHAARIVFESGIEIALFPLDVTWKVRLGPAQIARIRALARPAARTVADLLAFYVESQRQHEGGAAGAPLHDACTIAWLIDPTLFRGNRVAVRVETEGALTRGMTVADWRGKWGVSANCLAFDEADAPRIFDLLCERLGRL